MVVIILRNILWTLADDSVIFPIILSNIFRDLADNISISPPPSFPLEVVVSGFGPPSHMVLEFAISPGFSENVVVSPPGAVYTRSVPYSEPVQILVLSSPSSGPAYPWPAPCSEPVQTLVNSPSSGPATHGQLLVQNQCKCEFSLILLVLQTLSQLPAGHSLPILICFCICHWKRSYALLWRFCSQSLTAIQDRGMDLLFYCVNVHTSLFAYAYTDKSCNRTPRYLKCLKMKEMMETTADGMSW